MVPRAKPGETPAPWNRISCRVSPFIPTARLAPRSVFIKARIDQRFELLRCLRRVRSFAANPQLRALSGGQHHEPHDALAVDLFALFRHPDFRAIIACNTHEHRRRASMKPEASHNRN